MLSFQSLGRIIRWRRTGNFRHLPPAFKTRQQHSLAILRELAMTHAFKSILICVSLLLSCAAGARDIYVDNQNASANDSNAGTATAPLRTLTAGVALANAGDVVIVK